MIKLSRIIRSVKCKNCGKQYNDFYRSFGHPDEDFVWEWICECGHINKKLIKAWPLPQNGGWLKLNEHGEIVNESKENS